LDEKERGSGKLLERGQREIFLEREIFCGYLIIVVLVMVC
jgi:hypothetical protein